MQNIEEPQQAFDYEPAKIVQIAFRQLNDMSGFEDPCTKPVDPSMLEASNFLITRRLLEMPIFSKFSASISNVYNTLKESNEMVSSIFKSTEEGLVQGVKLVEPVTQKIGSTLETPLKCVDNVLCQGLDYIEDKVPCITASSGIFLTNIGNLFRISMATLTEFYINAVKRIQNISNPLSIEDANAAQQNPKIQKN